MKPILINTKVDLHHSPDDNGWYFREYDYKFRDRISQLFKTKDKALLAWVQNKIEWHKL